MKYATECANRPVEHNPRDTLQHLQNAGFTDIHHRVVGLPLNMWHPDAHEKEVARWYNLAICESVESLSLAAFTRLLGFTVDQVRKLSEDVRSETYDRNIRSYNVLHIYQARKPRS